MNSARISLQPKGFDGYAERFWRPRRLDFSSRCFAQVMNGGDLAVFDENIRGLEHCILDNMQHMTSLSTLLRAQNLVSLSLEKSSVTDAALSEVLQQCSSLEVLNVQGCMFLRGEWIECLKHTPRLKVLKMGGCGMDVSKYWNDSIQYLGGLETLVLMGNVVSDACIATLSQCKALRYVDIRKCSDVTYQSLYVLSTSCVRIETLKVGPLFHCSLEEVWQAIPKFKALNALEIYGHGEKPSRSLADILDRDLWHMPHLKKLSLMDTYCDWSTLKALSIACGQTLEYINLSQTRPGDVARCAAWDLSEYADVSFPKLTCLKAIHSMLHLNVMNALIRSSPVLEILDLSGCPCLKPPRIVRRSLYSNSRDDYAQHQCKKSRNSLDAFARALGSLTNLESLHLQNACIEDAHLVCTGKLTNLKVVDFSNNLGITDASLKHCVFWKNLKSINILNTSVNSQGMRYLPGKAACNLEEFCVSGNMSDICGEDILRFVSHSPRIRRLHIQDIQDVNDCVLQRIIDSCPRILDLSLAGCRSISPHGLRYLIHLRDLTRLDISRLRETVCDENLQYILANSCLSELRVSGAELSQSSLDALLESRMLHYIDISFCFGIGTDEVCANVVRKSGSPVKIRLPQGSTRLGLHDPANVSTAQRSLVF